MNNRYLKALISSSFSVAPIIGVTFILSFILDANGQNGLSSIEAIMLLIGLFVFITGLMLFQVGATIGLTKVGEYMGSSLSKQKKLFIVVLFAFALGALITCAEPSIIIFSKQVKINSVIMISSIAVGVGVFLVIGFLRIIFHRDLKLWYLLFYMITFMLLVFIAIDPERKKFLPFIFDSGGVTTGSATVPFILALGAGVATVRGGRNAKNDSFGLVGMASIGPIITMIILIMINNQNGDIAGYHTIGEDTNIFMEFIHKIFPYKNSTSSMIDVLIALAPILIIFFIYNILYIKLPKNKIFRLLFGFFLSFIGLSLFLCAASAVMTPVGVSLGTSLGKLGLDRGSWIIVVIAFTMGLLTILCEPAVHVLTTQICDISDGQIKKTTVLLTLSLGVGVAIALVAIRTIYHFSILYYIVPGYLISLLLMFICPAIYVAMAFDSGGTASGPMSTSFMLPLIAGVATSFVSEEDVFEGAFGVVALIALTPVIAIQVLGVVQNIKIITARRINLKYVYSVEDAQIIHF